MEFRTIAAWTAELTAHGFQVENKAAEAVRAAGFEAQRIARQLAPVDTGVLRASISVGHPSGRDTRPGDLAVQVGPTAEYGAFVEFGTTRAGAQPYMTPAAERVGPAFERRIADLGDI